MVRGVIVGAVWLLPWGFILVLTRGISSFVLPVLFWAIRSFVRVLLRGVIGWVAIPCRTIGVPRAGGPWRATVGIVVGADSVVSLWAIVATPRPLWRVHRFPVAWALVCICVSITRRAHALQVLVL